MNLKDLDLEPFESWVEEWQNYSKQYPSKSRKDRLRDGTLFYHSKEWRELRADVLAHYGRRCMKCSSTTRTLQVDHIQPRYYRPDLALVFENLQVLCILCNKEKGIQDTDYRKNKI